MATPAIAARDDRLAAASFSAGDWLHLAAAPTFAAMAALTTVLGGGVPDTLCAATQTGSTLSGMVWMYVLMSVFHSAPWLRLIFRTSAIGIAPHLSLPRRDACH